MSDSPKALYKEDLEFAKHLLSGEVHAWDRFYGEFRKKLEAYINRKYPNVFSEVAVEEIFDGVGKRLIEHDYKTLRDYRGECSISSYITRATDWEIRDWLRKHSDELLKDQIDTIGDDDTALKIDSSRQEHSSVPETEEIPPAVKDLTDDLRIAFLLRYYDYFGLPMNEIRLLAKKAGVPIRTITEKLINLLEPSGQDILRPQREKQAAFQRKLEKVCNALQKLSIEERKLASLDYEADKTKQQCDIGERRTELEKKRDILLKEKAGFVITTPYEVIAEIVGDNNISTIRSRIFLAKKQLAKKMMEKS